VSDLEEYNDLLIFDPMELPWDWESTPVEQSTIHKGIGDKPTVTPDEREEPHRGKILPGAVLNNFQQPSEPLIIQSTDPRDSG